MKSDKYQEYLLSAILIELSIIRTLLIDYVGISKETEKSLIKMLREHKRLTKRFEKEKKIYDNLKK